MMGEFYHFKVYAGGVGDFPGGPMVRTLHFHCRGHGLDPWSGIKTPHALRCGKKKKSI